jgi:predicted cupin superfamily sugar epimerase
MPGLVPGIHGLFANSEHGKSWMAGTSPAMTDYRSKMTSEPRTADEVIKQLAFKPHPEGGWFRETFRDEGGHQGRAHSTAILYLLKAGEVSRWHKVDAAELWHWYGGAPLLLEVKHGETRHEYRLGSDWHKGDHPHAAVPAHAWQSARSLGAWTLLGCTVAPGFDFSGFELAPEDFQR